VGKPEVTPRVGLIISDLEAEVERLEVKLGNALGKLDNAEAEVKRLRAAWNEDQTMVERDNERLSAEVERLRAVYTAAHELLWAFEHTYEDPGPGSRIPTLRRAVERASTAPVNTSDDYPAGAYDMGGE
jgi:chromosome segregation ATPase